MRSYQSCATIPFIGLLREESEFGFVEQIKSLFSSSVRVREGGVARIILAGLVVFIGLCYGFFPGSRDAVAYSFFVLLFFFFAKMKFEEVIVIHETPLYDPKLIFPEQFEREFKELVGPGGPVVGARIVTVIDDIDRCDSSTVRDVLTSVKTFVGEANCFFLIPCDDKTIVGVFDDASQKAGYKDEMLRKYFNVGLRMAPLMDTDLTDLANAVSRETEIPQAIVQFAILANCRDARKMKHFLNTFAVKYAVAKARYSRGFMSFDVDKNLAGFAKAVLIEDLYPGLYAEMVRSPRIYEVLEAAALQRKPMPLVEDLPVGFGSADFGELAELLRRTQDTRIENLEVLLSLKSSNLESRLPQGGALKNAIVVGDDKTAQELVSTITVDRQKTDLANLLTDLLRSQSDTFLRNTANFSLRIWSRPDYLTQVDGDGLAWSLCFALLRRDGQLIPGRDYEQIVRCTERVGGEYPELFYIKVEAEMNAQSEMPADIASLVSAVYRHDQHRFGLEGTLNSKFENWTTTDAGLSALLAIDLSPEIIELGNFPARVLLAKIALSMSIGETPGTLESNALRLNVLEKYWSEDLAEPLASRLLVILQQPPPSPDSTFRVSFVVDVLLSRRDVISLSTASKMVPILTQSRTITASTPLGTKTHQVMVLFAAASPEATTREAARTTVMEDWRQYSDEALREALAFLSGLNRESAADLQKQLVAQELSSAQRETSVPTDRTMQRVAFCFENRGLLQADALDNFLLSTLEAPDSAFDSWSALVADFAPRLDGDFSQLVADKCLSLLVGPRPLARRQRICELFATVLRSVATTSRPTLLQRYFAMCKHTDAVVRDAASGVMPQVKAAVDAEDFRIGLNTLVRDLCDIRPADAVAYRSALDAALNNVDLLDQRALSDLVAFCTRLLQEADTALQSYGIRLVAQLQRIPSEGSEDVVRLLINLARGESAALKEEATHALAHFPRNDLDQKAARVLDDFLNDES